MLTRAHPNSTGSWRQSAKFISLVEEPDTATATKRAFEEFKIGEPWKHAPLAAEGCKGPSLYPCTVEFDSANAIVKSRPFPFPRNLLFPREQYPKRARSATGRAGEAPQSGIAGIFAPRAAGADATVPSLGYFPPLSKAINARKRTGSARQPAMVA